MPTPEVPDEELRAAVEAVNRAVRDGYRKSGSPGALNVVADRLGLNRQQVEHRLRLAFRRLGIAPDYGLQLVRESTNGDGQVMARQFVPAREPHAEPEGQKLVRNSVLLDAEGGVVQQWRVYGPEGGVTAERLAEIVKEAVQAIEPTPDISPAPDGCDADLMNFLPETDKHLGSRSWAQETGENYDLKIARRLHLDATTALVSRLPRAALGIVLNGGDGLDINDAKNQTPASGNILDVDGRFAKVLMIGVQSEIDRVEIAKRIHEHVYYRGIPGNHDPEASFAVALALAHHYRDDPRVTIDLSPSAWWFYLWGECLLGATHGDKVKPEKMKGYMSDAVPEWWGQAKHRHIFYGHWHKQALIADGSTMVECLGTLTAHNAWAAPRFTGSRLMQAMTFHKSAGLVSRLYHNHVEAA